MENPFEIILQKLENIQNSLEELKTKLAESKNINDIFDVKEVAEHIKLSLPTIYGLVHKSKLPYYKKDKKLYFRKDEINKWLSEGRNESKAELNKMADEYIRKKQL